MENQKTKMVYNQRCCHSDAGALLEEVTKQCAKDSHFTEAERE